MTNDKALEAARQVLRYLCHAETPWSDEQVQAVISAYFSALPGEAEVVAWRSTSTGALFLPHHGDPSEDEALVTLAALQAMQARAEAAERGRDEARLDRITAERDAQNMATQLIAAEQCGLEKAAEAKRHLEAAMLSADPYQHIRAAIRSLGEKT